MPLSAEPVRTKDIPPIQCPACQAVLEQVTGTGAPAAGYISICAYCGVFLLVAEDQSLAVLSNAQWAALPLEQRQLLTHVRDGLVPLRARFQEPER